VIFIPMGHQLKSKCARIVAKPKDRNASSARSQAAASADCLAL
jgi:hypothetical protein